MERDEEQGLTLDRGRLETAYLAATIRAGRSGSTVELDFDVAVAEEYLRLSYIESDASIAGRVARSKPYLARIRDVSFEESSQRYVIGYSPVPDTGKVEHVRSDRADSARGAYVMRVFGDPALPGKLVRIYRYNEKQGEDPKHAAGFRNVAMIRPVGR